MFQASHRNCVHMLFVDDSPTQRALWMYALSETGAIVRHEANRAEACAGGTPDKPVVEIYVASSGAKALELMQLLPIDLLITDIEMPDMTGWEVAKAGLGMQRNLKVFVCSSKVVTGDTPPDHLPPSRVKLFSKADRKLAMKAATDFTGGILHEHVAPTAPRLAYA